MTNKKRLTITVVAVVLLSAAGLLAWGLYQNRSSSASAESAYQLATVESGDIVLSVSTSGTVDSQQAYDLHPAGTGQVTGVFVKAGDTVTKGQVIASLDDAEARANLAAAEDNLAVARSRLEQTQVQASVEPAQIRLQTEQATANLLSAQSKLKTLKEGAKPQEVEQARSAVRQAQANLDAAQTDYGRLKTLLAEGGVSKQQLDTAENKYLTAVESLKTAQQKLDLALSPPDPVELAAAEAAARQAQANLEVVKANAKAGSAALDLLTAKTQVQQAENAYLDAKKSLASTTIVSPIDGVVVSLNAKPGDYVSNQSILGTVGDLRRLEVNAYVDETEVAQVQIGQKVDVTGDAFPDVTFAGQVTNIGQQGQVTDNVVSFLVTVNILDTKSLLKPGMTVDTEIISQRRTNVLVIPNGALADRRGRLMARMLEDGKPTYRRIELGITDGRVTEVLSGLKRGDVVAIEQSGTRGTQQTTQQSNQWGNNGGNNPQGGLRSLGLGAAPWGGR